MKVAMLIYQFADALLFACKVIVRAIHAFAEIVAKVLAR